MEFRNSVGSNETRLFLCVSYETHRNTLKCNRNTPKHFLGGRLGAPPTAQYGCFVEEFQRYKANYEAWYWNYMSWGDYYRYIQNTYHVSISAYPDPGPVYVSARHSTVSWM